MTNATDTVHIGDALITAIAEQPLTGLNHLIAMAKPESVRDIDWLTPNYADESGVLLGVVHAFVIQLAGSTILVDTCIGNGKRSPRGARVVASQHRLPSPSCRGGLRPGDR